MTKDIDELLCGDNINLIYGDDWYFKMAKKHLRHHSTSECQTSSNSYDKETISHTETLKDAA